MHLTAPTLFRLLPVIKPFPIVSYNNRFERSGPGKLSYACTTQRLAYCCRGSLSPTLRQIAQFTRITMQSTDSIWDLETFRIPPLMSKRTIRVYRPREGGWSGVGGTYFYSNKQQRASEWPLTCRTNAQYNTITAITQLHSTENYGRRCLTPLSPHRNYNNTTHTHTSLMALCPGLPG